MNMQFEDYLSGNALYGDNFSLAQIEKWFQEEAEGYSNLGAKNKDSYTYKYHCLNRKYAYSALKNSKDLNVLGIGSAYGDEFLPIIERIAKITILDPSEAFSDRDSIGGVACQYSKPNISGEISLPNNNIDLVSCLGVLHHIPNVTFMLRECFRVLRPGGIMILREPIVSMGDWRKPRMGLTKNERGIPLEMLRTTSLDAGFTIENENLCIFPPLVRLADRLGIACFNSPILTALDALLSKCWRFNYKYHRDSLSDKFAPSSVYFVLTKPHSI